MKKGSTNFLIDPTSTYENMPLGGQIQKDNICATIFMFVLNRLAWLTGLKLR